MEEEEERKDRREQEGTDGDESVEGGWRRRLVGARSEERKMEMDKEREKLLEKIRERKYCHKRTGCRGKDLV